MRLDSQPLVRLLTYAPGAYELGRLLIAESSDDEDEDALFPLYAAIGADLSRQRLAAKTGNVPLEEMSAYHYLRAFWSWN